MKDFKICKKENCKNKGVRIKITKARYKMTEDGLVPSDLDLLCEECRNICSFESEKEIINWKGKPPLIKGLSNQEPDLDEKSVLKRQEEEAKYGRQLRWYERK